MFFYLKISFFICLLFAWSNCFAQIFGGNPPSIKWKQINTPSARVIFPAGLASTATRITNVIKFIKGSTENTIGVKSKKINIVLQNQTTISNAYVGLGPYRSEFFLTPTQNSFEIGSLPWPDQLVIHEYRHVEQFNNFNVGLSGVLRFLFGEEGQSLANNTAIPNWFFEGDAVYNETDVSRQGRGKLPFFYNGYRSLWNAGKHYSWMKLRNGSFKDFVPNHYDLGYLLVAYGREKYGDKFWGNVTQDAASFKGLFYPFQRAIKKYSGTDYVTFRNDAIDFFKKQFDLHQKNTIKKQPYVNEEYPAFEGDTIIYVKSGYKQIPEFIIKTGNSEKKLRVRDYSLDNYFSLRNGKIVYASYRPDTRWGYRDFSDLRILDITNGKQQMLTNRTKYFSPDISEDGKRVVAVDQSVNGKAAFHILDAVTGNLIDKIPNPDRLFYTYPKFFEKNKIISAVRDTSGKMSLAEIDIQTGNTKYLTPLSYNVIGFPCISHDTIYFSCSFKKNDELFAYTLANKKIWQIIYKNVYGPVKYQPTVNDSIIAWSTFTPAGYKLEKASKKDIEFRELTPDMMNETTSTFGIASLIDKNSNLLSSVPNDKFDITKYSKTFRLLNFHSIEPTVNDPEYTLTLLSENVLNTLQSKLSFTYDRAERFKRVGFAALYGGLFPFISTGINYTMDRRKLSRSQLPVYFNELEPYAGLNIPLNFSKGRSFTFLNFGSQYVYNKSAFKGLYKDTLGNISYSYINNFLSFNSQVQKARQQIFPHFAQSLNLSYKTALTHYKGYQFLANGNIYLPGFLKTHSIVLNAALLTKDSSRQINFSSGFPFSRGYEAANFYKMYKWGINYHLPLLYPDAGFGNLFYLLRVRGALFYDHTYVNDFLINGNSFTANFNSAGAEVSFDTKWWNVANVSIGVRYSYLFDRDLFGNSGNNRWEIILPVNIFNQ
ncbi:MAG: hypothetical protein ABIO81_13635 [Ginsengibacter sp.]